MHFLLKDNMHLKTDCSSELPQDQSYMPNLLFENLILFLGVEYALWKICLAIDKHLCFFSLSVFLSVSLTRIVIHSKQKELLVASLKPKLSICMTPSLYVLFAKVFFFCDSCFMRLNDGCKT